MAFTGLDINKPGLALDNPSTFINAITWDNRRACNSQVTAIGTNQATAYQINGAPAFVEITSAASGTGICLDLSSQGDRLTITNNGTSTIAIYTTPMEVGVNKINGTAGATGVTQAAGVTGIYFCVTPGQWYRISGS